MIKEILYKWFGVEERGCVSCEVLRNLLDKSEFERRELLAKLLEKEVPIERIESAPAPEVVRPVHVPWSIRRQILENEDRAAARKLRDKNREIQEVSKLEQELGIVEEK